MFCFTPLLLAGYLFMLPLGAAHTTDLSSGVVQGQTCEHGPGLEAKVTTSGMVGLHAQYGFSYATDEWVFVFTPKAGGAVLPYHVPELTSTVNFSLGLQTMVGYDHARFSIEYWHQSNAGLGEINGGLDMLTVMGGWSF